MNKKLMLLTLATCLAGCATTVEQINKDIKKFNESMNNRNATTTSVSNKNVSSSSFVSQDPPLSDTQKKQLQTHFAQKITDTQLKAMIQEAKPSIERVLSMQACFYPSNVYGKYLYNPNSHYNFRLTDWLYFKHHDKSQCLNIERISSWRVVAKNAFVFNTTYVSAQSGESEQVGYSLEKQLDGAWLFK